MADLFIIKRRLKFSLWLALIGTGLAGLATWYFYSQLEFEVDNHKFLLSAAITGAMALGTVGLVLFNLAARRVIDPSQSLTDRIDNLPWWTVKVVALLVMIGVLGGVVYRFSGRAEDEFDLLRDDELVVLKERIEANPAVLERKENKKSGITLVQVAYRENRSEAVELLLASGASVDGLDAMGRNPVIASLNNLPMLEILLGAGMDPNMADAEGVPPIHYAISLNSTNVVGLLLDAGAKIDGRDYLYRTPLMRAVKSDNLPMAGFLLEKGADVNAFDQRGNTPLHVAVRRRNEESVRLLLEKGADPKVFNFSHMTP
ncbi:MAG: ankyrin repeat domain-containing protein, partial [Kiritimatiellaceae bacterium]|nr:ankyrin repeat domain-containing protein [Kiritimatiellaceae bacterium]